MSDSDSDAPPGYIDFDNVETNEGWWDDGAVQAVKKGERRWTTLSHNGVMFPPPYEPHGIPILYAGREFHMTPEEEEVATMFAKLRENDYYRQPEFRQNFFKSWMKILNKRGEHPIRELELCNFDKIWEWWQRQREIKKNRTREEKKKDKDEQNKIAAPFKYCIWDGKKEEVANYRVEPPEPFRGRGEHPLRGTLKRRVTPEDITINIDPTAKPPPCPAGHKWGAIVHDNTKTWLATWEDNVTGGTKYVMLAPSSTVKGVSDREKFERARRLHKHIDKIRKWYRDQMSSSDEQQQQLGVATYFIDKLALRVGNEKSTDEADTVGCCSLRVEHCTPLPNNQLHLHFLGKDSIPYDNIVDVDAQVYKLVQQFLHGKREKKMIFDLVDPSDLNDNFKQFMPDLTAKVFRTYNASKCLEDYFQANPLPKKASLSEKMVYFNKANTEVAVLCNHQKSVSKGHVKLMAKMSAQIEIQRATIDRLRKAEKELAKKGAETVAREFFAAQDAEQQEWLDQYGTEQEKEEFEKEKIERFEKPIKTSGTKSSPSKTSGKKKPSSGGTKTRTIDDLDDDDVPLVALAGRTSGRATKKEPKKEEKVKVEPDDDDDTPIAALLPGKNGKGGKKAASVKKEKTPEPQEDEADEEGEEEEEEEGEEEEEEEQPAKGGKKPAAKKSPAKSKKTSPKKPAAKKAAKKASGKKPAGKAAAGKKKKPAPKKGGKKK